LKNKIYFKSYDHSTPITIKLNSQKKSPFSFYSSKLTFRDIFIKRKIYYRNIYPENIIFAFLVYSVFSYKIQVSGNDLMRSFCALHLTQNYKCIMTREWASQGYL